MSEEAREHWISSLGTGVVGATNTQKDQELPLPCPIEETCYCRAFWQLKITSLMQSSPRSPSSHTTKGTLPSCKEEERHTKAVLTEFQGSLLPNEWLFYFSLIYYILTTVSTLSPLLPPFSLKSPTPDYRKQQAFQGHQPNRAYIIPYTETKHILSHRGWTREPSREERVPQVDKSHGQSQFPLLGFPQKHQATET